MPIRDVVGPPVYEEQRHPEGPESREVASALNNLGVLLLRQRKRPEAAAYLERALRLHQQLLPPDHPRVVNTALNLAASLDDRERARALVAHGLEVYVDLVSDPVATVRRIYAHFEIEFSTAFEAGLGRMLASRPRERRALHEYSFSDTGLDLAEERARHAAYQERYDVPSEV